MFDAIKKLVIEPSDTFANIEERAGFSHATLIILIWGLLSAVPEILQVRDPSTSGVILLVLARVFGMVIIWGVMGLVIYLLAVKLSNGSGSMSAIYIALGIAASVRMIENFVGVLVAMGGASMQPFDMAFFGWYTVLLVLLVRELNKLTTGRSIMVVMMVGIVALAASMPLKLMEYYIYPGLYSDPFEVDRRIARRMDGWEDDELPGDVENLFRNSGFERIIAEDFPGAEELTAEERENLPQSWLPVPIPLRRRNTRDDLLINRISFDFDRVTDISRSGSASALTAHYGAPVGLPIGWGWSQPVFSRQFIAETRRREEERAGAEGREMVERWELESSVVSIQEDDNFYLSIWMRGEDIVAATIFAAVGVAEESPTIYFATETLEGDFTWTEQRLRFPVPANAERVYGGAILWGGGRLWIDDAQLMRRRVEEDRPIDEDPPELMPD